MNRRSFIGSIAAVCVFPWSRAKKPIGLDVFDPAREALVTRLRQYRPEHLWAWLERAFRYGNKNKILVNSPHVRAAIQQVSGHRFYEFRDTLFGVGLTRYVCAHGELLVPNADTPEVITQLEKHLPAIAFVHEAIYPEELARLIARKYHTGDPHPTSSLLRFVEYDPKDGQEVWCSICRDKSAPYVLRARNELERFKQWRADRWSR